jgi:hypothetical protein
MYISIKYDAGKEKFHVLVCDGEKYMSDEIVSALLAYQMAKDIGIEVDDYANTEGNEVK